MQNNRLKRKYLASIIENGKKIAKQKHHATNAEINLPCGVFVAPNDEVYIADSINHRVRKILQNGRIVTIAGNGQAGFSGDDGPATNARLSTPRSVFVSSNNEVYIADFGNCRIRKILGNGNIITIAGTGQAGFSGDNGPATNAQFVTPCSVFVSADDEVYIVDRTSHVIRKIFTNGNIVTIAGNGQAGFSGDDGPATNAQLNNPYSVFVSSNNEVYIADFGNCRIRKILGNGNIVTIAGNGRTGISGDNGPATNAKISKPLSVFVSANNEVYISEIYYGKIRKILGNGNIVTIAGTGQAGFSGDNGPATNAQLNYPCSIFVPSNNEVYIADCFNNRIRKILGNGNIVTIAGNGQAGFSGDSAFDVSLYPHIGSSKSNTKLWLKKHQRDQLFGIDIYGFIPLIEKVSPQFCTNILKNEKLVCCLNTPQQEIVQKLIDSLIYRQENELQFKTNETIDALFILGLFQNSEFVQFKISLTSKFVATLTLENLCVNWENIELLLTLCKSINTPNKLLQHLDQYCLEYASVQLKTQEGCILATSPIIMKKSSSILLYISLTQPNPITIDENVEIESQGIKSLYNDEKTSDVKIKMGMDKYLYCHKTILSSCSTLFNALFESGSSFSDLSDNTFIPSPDEDLELLEIIIKYCYEIPLPDNIDSKIFSLLDMATKHEIIDLIDYCKNSFTLSIDNYFKLVQELEKYLHLDCFLDFYNKVLRFGIINRKTLFTDYELVSRLPGQLRTALIIQLSTID